MYTAQRRVEFRDTDAAGIAHFSAFFPLMESVEHEMLRSLGISVMPARATSAAGEAPGASRSAPLPQVTWPRVSVQCDYRAAARFEDLLDVAVTVRRLGTSSVEYGFRITRRDG
ncbi:MAG: acyl-CoA thioesterase, partial [Novipirellula sp. JB048]